VENGEKILSLLEKMYIDVNKRLLNLETGLSEVKADLGSVKADLGSVKADLGSVKAIVIKIEHDHGQKLGALFDGHKHILDRLERVEAQVSKHEEIIFRRVK